MFSYYGSKSKLINYYPPPTHSKIIEPFAGSARYALKYWDRDVLLVDKYEVIIRIWQFLQRCAPSDILGLPDIAPNQSVDEFNLSPDEKSLIGFCINRGSANPKKSAKVFNSWSKDKVRIAGDLCKIRHWQIRYGEYDSIANEQATWFIDPPYQVGGKYYRHNNKQIDYAELCHWSEARFGQVIVCESAGATWMDFQPLAKLHGARHNTKEVYWHRADKVLTP